MTPQSSSTTPPRTSDGQLLSEHSVLSLLTSASAHLRSLGFDEARLHVEWILARILGLKRLDLYLQFDRPLTREEVDRFKALYRRRLEHEPLQYLLGDTEFMGLRFIVDRRVLIPRPETEILVERALEILHASGTTEPHVLDIGTGSGNIALTVASKAPGARVTAIDVSEEALQVAATNAQLLRVEHVEFVQTDIRDTPLAGRAFDLILANPPYVSRDEYEHLPPELRDHEPREALTDEGDGRLLLDRILSFSPERLLPEGTLLMEMGAGQSDWCLARAAECGFTEARVHADHAGIPRILEARRGDAGGSER